MGGEELQRSRRLWALARQQHFVVTRAQLLALGFSTKAIEHRLGSGRLHRWWRGVYAVGRPQLTLHGRWMAAVLPCGPDSALSHGTAAALWGICPRTAGIEVSVPARTARARPGITVHRRARLGRAELTRKHLIPVTAVVCTLVDLATRLDRWEMEAAINQADKLDLVDAELLRRELARLPGRPGAAKLRRTLDRHTFTLTDSHLERLFLPIVRDAGLPEPLTQRHVNGFRVDFYWPELDLIVETDGLRYHRTPAQQARDGVRDHAHSRSGTSCLRFTRAQVRFERPQVLATLVAVTRRLKEPGSPRGA